jgi:hypothetical protein
MADPACMPMIHATSVASASVPLRGEIRSAAEAVPSGGYFAGYIIEKKDDRKERGQR